MERVRSTLIILLGFAGAAAAGVNPGYYRFPSLRGDTVVFTSEGDLWKVGVGGGIAQRLTSHPGEESHAAISPDGLSVAFSATYEGPTEVYLMPLAGGLPQRLTWDGGDAQVVGWTPDAKVLYATRRYSTLPNTQLFTLDPNGGARTPIPLAQASDGSYDPTGATLFFTRLAAQGSHTKRYRGGTAQNLWRFTPGAGEATPLAADYPGTSKAPMWWRGRVYFASDRDGTMNLWSMDEHGGDLRQHTHHNGWDVAWPALDDGRIVYQLGADLRLYDIASDRDTALRITLASDFDQLRDKWVDKPMEYLTAAYLSPTGDRVALTLRGQVLVAPVKQGRLVEVSHVSGVRYRQAHFMGDGKSVVALSDQSGEVEWCRLPANGVGEPDQLTHDGTVLRFDGVPSPDGAWIAYFDKNDVLWLFGLNAHKTVKVAASVEGQFSDLAWSPDSRWLAFVMPADNGFGRVMLYHVDDGTILPITTDRTDSESPAWSPDGKWIYVLSDRNLVSAVGSPWGSRQPEPFLDRPTKLYAVALVPGQRSPFQPSDELQPVTDKRDQASDEHGEAQEDETRKKSKSTETAKKPPAKVAVDLGGIATRIYEIPVPPGEYHALTTNGDRLFWLSRQLPADRKSALLTVDVSNREPKVKTLVEGVTWYDLSADGKKVLIQKDDALAVFDASADKVELADKKIDTARWRFPIQPRDEWRQMFREAWRLERDYFYDRKMHGLDWPAVRAKYEPLVERVADRAELSDLLGQMIGELSALHMFVYGGDFRKGADTIEPASLGAVLEREQAAGGYRVAHVYRSDPDYPERLSPLAAPGVEVHDGDVIQAINGVATLGVPDPAVLLRDQADRQVLLRVASGGSARDVVVKPISPEQESGLRYDEWEYTRRLRVEEAGKGEIGYVHLRAMTRADWTEWARDFYPVFKRAGLIVDVRHNRGGNIDSWILEKLLRRAWFYWQPRVGDPYWNMQYAFRGHLVVLIDQNTASDGEAFAEGFRRFGLGKLIGTRTWGGEIWLSSSNLLADKGIATAAETGVYGPEGQWLIEGRGVEPDIVVDDLPWATYGGSDAQLDAAVKHLQELIRREPVPAPTPPPYPNKAPVRQR